MFGWDKHFFALEFFILNFNTLLQLTIIVSLFGGTEQARLSFFKLRAGLRRFQGCGGQGFKLRPLGAGLRPCLFGLSEQNFQFERKSMVKKRVKGLRPLVKGLRPLSQARVPAPLLRLRLKSRAH